VLELDDGEATDGEKGREKRKIGVTLGITNGIVSFVFGVSLTLNDSRYVNTDIRPTIMRVISRTVSKR